MSQDLEIPASISKFGVTKNDLPMLAAELMTFTGALEQNPVKVTRKMIEEFMVKMI